MVNYSADKRLESYALGVHSTESQCSEWPARREIEAYLTCSSFHQHGERAMSRDSPVFLL